MEGIADEIALPDVLVGKRLTPMFRQWAEAKAEAPDALLLFRMGDFYECFFDDAKRAARELDLTLTARDKLGEEPVPMAGVPHHALRPYLAKLVQAGIKVAIAEQLEDPRFAKGIVKRGVVEIVTPGLVLDPDALDARAPNYLLAALSDGDHAGIAWADASTGDFACATVPLSGLGAELARIAPAEVHVLEGDRSLAEAAGAPPTLREGPVSTEGRRWAEAPAPAFDARSARQELCALWGLAELTGLGFGPGDDLAQRAAGGLLRSLRAARLDALSHLRPVRLERLDRHMVIDEATRRNLELFRTLSGDRRQGSLVALVDRAASPLGGRRLRAWLSAPLRDLVDIRARHDAVERLVEDGPTRTALSDHLANVDDIERLNARVQAGRANPRDLRALARSLRQAPSIDTLLAGASFRACPLFAPLPDLSDVADVIEAALIDEPPAQTKDGGYIRPGYSRELDELLSMSSEGKGALARIEAEERARTGIASLKVRYNRVFGYFIEVTRANLDAVPEDYIRKQTLANAERFLTPELKDWEEKVLHAEERRIDLEQGLFDALVAAVAARGAALSELGSRLADIDAVFAFADCAARFDYVRPQVDASRVLDIEGGRHPVIERMPLEERFVPNDVRLDEEAPMLVLTGPNMAGKSTVMRQAALIVLLAQSGSFVPASRARVGVVDRIFTRVGASDDLSRGRSTFMVEMAETAAILHGATERSFAVLDEIGRGTSTFDGLAIAWAVAEHLVDKVRCRAMFATHYHELVELRETRTAVQNANVAVSEAGGRIVFLRRLRPGGASRSYGIQVAKLAGLPEPVLQRAREVLANLERGQADDVGRPHLARNRARPAPPAGQLQMFASPRDAVIRELLALDPDTMTPLQAMVVLADLRAKAQRA